MNNGYWHDGMGGNWWWMALAMLVFWGGVAAVVISLLRRPGTRPEGAKAILAERFARGEIDADEYRRGVDALATR